MNVTGPGVGDVHARIAEIRGRLADLGGPAAAARVAVGGGPAVSAGSPPATRTLGVPSPATAAAPAAVPAATTAAPAAAARAGAGSGTATGSVDATALAQRLPAAGKRWAGPITDAARKHGLDPALLAALVDKESGFDPSVRSHAGAIGLGQLMPGTAAGLGVDPHDPLQNLDGAARYLKQQLDRFGRTDLALAAYNAGPNRVAQAGGVPRITETRNYVDRVLAAWERYR